MSAPSGPPRSVVLFGEALIDELPSGPVPGGAPLNVARHLRAFGVDPLLITRVGRDEPGDLLVAAMHGWGLDTRGVQRDREHQTGHVAVRMTGGSHRFEIPPFQAWDFIDATAAAGALRASPDFLYFGTLAQRHHESRRALRELLGRGGGRCLLDVNLRAPWYDLEIIETALVAADVLKLSENELDTLADLLRLPGGVASRADALMTRFSISEVVVTFGPEGAQLIEAGGARLRVCGTPLDSWLVDTVGAGDAFMAVLLLGERRGWPPDLALARAERFARAICRIAGAIPDDPNFYEPYVVEWGLEGSDDDGGEERVHLHAERPRAHSRA